jgi:hypothetical protein
MLDPLYVLKLRGLSGSCSDQHFELKFVGDCVRGAKSQARPMNPQFVRIEIVQSTSGNYERAKVKPGLAIKHQANSLSKSQQAQTPLPLEFNGNSRVNLVMFKLPLFMRGFFNA